VCGIAGVVAVVLIAVLIVHFLVFAVQRGRKRSKADEDDSTDNANKTGAAAVGTRAGAKAGQHNRRRVVVLKSDSCGHCRALAPVIASLQAQGVRIESVDAPATFAHEWFADNGISGFPTICELLGDRVVHIFKGRRTAENIAAYVNERLH
jgi:thiol-disulfide isomerase/thioredoxin